MGLFLKLDIRGTRTARRGRAYFWQVLLERTADGSAVGFAEILEVCDDYQDGPLHKFLNGLITGGFLEKIESKPNRYRLLKRQPEYPVVGRDGAISFHGARQQQMWNVIRRSRDGFTVEQLAVDASTDMVAVGVAHAGSYISRLFTAEILVASKARESGGQTVYRLKASANSGPKAPKVLDVKLVFDPNTGKVVGPTIAEEER